MPRQRGISSELYKYLVANKGVELHGDDIAEDLGYQKQQIQGAIANLRKNNGINIDSPQSGWYIYRGGKNSGGVGVKAKAEVIRLLENDRLLLEIEGRLYVATELEV